MNKKQNKTKQKHKQKTCLRCFLFGTDWSNINFEDICNQEKIGLTWIKSQNTQTDYYFFTNK